MEQERKKPTMLDAEQVASRLNMSKGYAYKIIQQINDEQVADFVDVYAAEVRPRIREHTWINKEYMIKDKLIPFFGKMRMSDIKPVDVVRWQNELITHPGKGGKPYSPTYLRTLNNQLSAIFNHAERYYDLQNNPCSKVAKIGSKKGKEMQFWTKDEYLKFSDAIMDKPLSFYIFETLYWTGIRVGELLTLTPADFLFGTSEPSTTKSYQCLRGVDTITDPKTPKSIRRIAMPKFLADEMKEYLEEFRTDITYRYAHLFPNKQSEIANALNGTKGGD